jgi:serine/threonine protein phosphatase PrpC
MASSLDSSILFGVFDGHGEFGGEASTQIAQMLPTNVYEGEDLDCSSSVFFCLIFFCDISAYYFNAHAEVERLSLSSGTSHHDSGDG